MNTYIILKNEIGGEIGAHEVLPGDSQSTIGQFNKQLN